MVIMDGHRSDPKESSFRGADLKLFVRSVWDPHGRKRPITVRSWSCIKDIKDVLQQTIHIPVASQRLFFGPLMTSGKELPNHRTLHDAGIYKSGEILFLDIKEGGNYRSYRNSFAVKSRSNSDLIISSSVVAYTPRLLIQLVQEARRALALGLKPELVLDGSGGTYFLHDARKTKIAVFKPADEEPYAENNPRGYLPQAGQTVYLREGVVPGEACIREVAAFMLDHQGFSDVPMTTLVEARHPVFNTNGAQLNVSQGGASIGAHSISSSGISSKSAARKVGSFQEFVRTECTMDDISPSKISVDEVHKIAILDIRLMNADRNAANLLCKRRSDNSFQLIPIDHGFTLRSCADVSWMDWCWLDWPQMKQPVSDRTKEYILGLDIEGDAQLLQERLNIGRDAIDYFCASSSILKAGIKAGLTLYDIAVMCCRNDNLGEIPSKLEALFSMAADLADSAIENGRWDHSAASRALADQLAPNAGSLLNSSPSAIRMRKSVSAVDVSQYAKDLAEFEVPLKQEPLPGMIQSSASDSSSDTGELELEACEEWAADVIADVSMEKSFSLMDKRKGRSFSIESDGSNDSSNSKGFWHTHPDNDDTSVASWESLTDLEDQIELPSTPDRCERRMSCAMSSYNPIDKVVDPSQKSTDAPLTKMRSPPKVKFDATVKEKDTVPDAKFKHSNSDVGAVALQKRSDCGGLKRSQSYSGLSSVSQKSQLNSDVPPSKAFSHEHEEQRREYFLSFVALVITRETIAAARLANH
eukprot:scaffold1900_cov123-Cylindrotheca_fusiformis.AAC.3